MAYKILLGNLGYLRGINGKLSHHLAFAHRHFYCPPAVQKLALGQLVHILSTEDPDICCFVEIDKHSLDSGKLNQLETLVREHYTFGDIENKYGQHSRLRTLPMTRGKSNAFLSKRQLHFEKIYFTRGTKRLIYKITVAPEITLFFAHFSLKKDVRLHQLLQVRALIKETQGEIILLGDFNILSGFGELSPLMHENNLVLLNRHDHPTFRFHRFEKVLDLCICTPGIAEKIDLRVIPQPYSDHAALLVTMEP